MSNEQQFELLILDGEGGYQRHDAGPLEQVRDSADSARLHARGLAIVTAERASKLKRGRLPGSRPSAPRQPRAGWPKWLKWPTGNRHGRKVDEIGNLDEIDRRLIDRQVTAAVDLARRAGSVTFWAPGESALADDCRERVLEAIGGPWALEDVAGTLEHHGITMRTAHAEDWTSSAIDDGPSDER